ncbi:acyltransferase [Pelagibacterium nitratireducens]|uniref:Acyltransferase n=1 Tax=Pelagibacterium nitratireducens TaxID=1046114 RepID=A0ABZ2HZZ6_9HYPH
MAFHYLYSGIVNNKINSVGHIEGVVGFVKYGYLGVEFFFIISGYVIFHSALRGDAAAFLAARCVRLFPAFWAAVIITSLAAQMWGTGLTAVTAPQFFANMTMFPYLFGEGYVDGVYWTLRYEWQFYLGVFLILLFVRPKRLTIFILIWPIYISANYFWLRGGLPLAGGYYAYFSAGALFAVFTVKRQWYVLAMLALSALLCLHFSLQNAAEMSLRSGREFSSIVVASAVLCMFFFFTFLQRSGIRDLRLPGSKTAGAMSYPLYLVHAHLGFMLISNFGSEENKILVYSCVSLLVMLIAYLIHSVVENLSKKFWKRLFKLTIHYPLDFVQSSLSKAFVLLQSSKRI